MILTIAIPIFNGEKNLHITLDSILISLPENCEVVVSDNASTDQTAQIALTYQTQYPDVIRYFVNKENIGYDKNIDTLFEKSQGTYVWLLGCGEKIKKNSLYKILKLIQAQEFDVCVLNFDIFSENKGITEKKYAYPLQNTMITFEAGDFSFPRYSNAVSANIINKTSWQSIKEVPLIENGWCHVERILSIIGHKNFKSSVYIGEPCFTLFRDKDGWWSKPNSYLLHFLIKHINIIRSIPQRGMSVTLAQMLEKKQTRWVLLMAVIQSKSYGMKVGRELLAKMVLGFGREPIFWLVVLPSLLIPSIFFVSLRRSRDLYHKFFY
jgi:glycosyltransferase involved in cell wall biosynthesis